MSRNRKVLGRIGLYRKQIQIQKFIEINTHNITESKNKMYSKNIYIYDFEPVLGWTTFRQENTWASLDFSKQSIN